MEIVAVSLLVLFVVTIWLLVCNQRTLRDRLKIIWSDDFDPEAFDKVDYESHLWMRVTFRNPSRLYAK